jgi:hypothetical protein
MMRDVIIMGGLKLILACSAIKILRLTYLELKNRYIKRKIKRKRYSYMYFSSEAVYLAGDVIKVTDLKYGEKEGLFLGLTMDTRGRFYYAMMNKKRIYSYSRITNIAEISIIRRGKGRN